MAEITKAQYVKEQLTVQGLKDTPANRKKLRAEYDTKYGAGKSADWRDGFKLEFPQYSDWIDGEEGEARARQDFGDDLIDLFFDYAKNPQNYDLVSEAGRRVWAQKVQATNLYTKFGPNRRDWTITPEPDKQEQIEAKKVELLEEFGSLELNDRQLVDIATYALSNKASKTQVKYYTYSVIAGRTPSADGPDALSETDDATALRNALKRFNYSPPGLEEQIASALTNKPYLNTTYTADLLIKKARDNAKIMMPHFSQQFEEGYTLDDVFEPYKNIAARTLELNPLDINYGDPKFMTALNRKPDGTSMSASEWEYMLKKDPKYKWSETKQGKQKASEMINLLERALGQVIG
jgi:hypothetical protein